ncbi:glycosyltransferase family 2 protein [Flagellimonas iocasae]|uniref:Glycosyltransferase family 2 protein n=1 Tax=Flagellimonas iocasae TaxID=2055905 RepID=A0ABW4XUX6_9FLAO
MFSVITPTYNRAHTLDRVYNSLRNQTKKSFHWVIVDDASTDNTEELVQRYLKESNDFKIEYHKRPINQGKPAALNYGFEFCTEPITVIADSDDSFVPNTMSDLEEIWNRVNQMKNGSKIATVWTLVEDERHRVVGDYFPYDFWQANLHDRLLEKNMPVKGEKWHSWRTNVLKKYQMYSNELCHIGESATWHTINIDFDFLHLNMVHRMYYDSEDGLINKKRPKLKSAMTKYFTAYHQLAEVKPFNIIKYRYYNSLAFNYMKSKIFFGFERKSLSSLKNIICFLIFLFLLPYTVLHRK